MIELSSIQVNNLPSHPLDKSENFPKRSCIYFAIDSQDNIQYIGRTVNANNRWKSHHRYEQLKKIGGVRVAYLFIDDINLLPEIEDTLIKHFKPLLNNVVNPDLKGERIRIDVWASLRPTIEAEIERTGLTAQEVVNIALADYFGLTPSSRNVAAKASEATTTKSDVATNDDDDYI